MMNDTPIEVTEAKSGNDAQTRVHRSSWAFLIDGILLVLLAAVLVIRPENGETWFIRLLGILSLGGGALLGYRFWTSPRSIPRLYWLVCIIPLAVGAALLIWPVKSYDFMVYIVAITLLVRGIVECTLALSRNDLPGWELLLLHGGAGIALGILFFIWPTFAPILLILFLGVGLIVRGALQVSLTSMIRKKMNEQGVS